MKTARKISSRERWMLALAPAAIIAAAYGYLIAGSLAADLGKQQARLDGLGRAPAPAAAPPALAAARAARDAAAKELEDRQARVADLEARAASFKTAPAPADESEPARVIEHVEAVFARHGITPLISEAAGESDAGNPAPDLLVSALGSKAGPGSDKDANPPRLWHCIFDDQTPRLQRALREVVRESPTVVPLSLNFAYNPQNDGETRLLELWLLY